MNKPASKDTTYHDRHTIVHHTHTHTEREREREKERKRYSTSKKTC